ncbi:glycosyltransferase [Alteromonas sp. 1_MG-2023]|uniref:glycosyltransferase n=1 Tax=Alteromonas sp. 1_MG-2023 TaxID=3062669 RepID=UPI0026E1A362|nr:glycosyltransferase [Alteromonas sp. 1_MG-2023]MDO6567899.1 glycosyltransferase [Alteromonas sp. 1_MG-2023]
MTNAPSQVVVFCPLPPKPNGIADYFAEQIPYFSRTTQVVVVVENEHPEPTGIAANITVLRLEEYMWRQADFACVPHIYHVGNNPDTQYMLPVLLSKPGVVVVHDLNLHYLVDLTNLSKGDKKGYELALTNNYGEVGKIIGQQLNSFGWKGQFMPHELMMNASIITAAERILVHSKYSADKIAALGHNQVKIVPHHFSPAARQYQPKLKMHYRGQLGLPGNKPVITSMGFIAKAKQIKSVLTALAALKQEGLDFTYVLAGQCKPHEYDVHQDIADSGLVDNVIVTGFLDEDAFFKYMLASDLIVNLRYPTGGESSGTLTRAMGMGLCCVVVNIGPFGELPNDCAVKLNWDERFSDNLQNQLKRLIEDKQYRVTFGKNAQKWVERTHNIAVTTKAYLNEAAQIVDATNFTTKALNNSSRKYLTEQQVLDWRLSSSMSANSNNLWWQANTVPIEQSSVLSISHDSLHQTTVLSSLFGYGEEQITQLTPECLSQHSIIDTFPLVVCDASLNDIAHAPVNWFANLNKVAGMGGKLIISLQNPNNLFSEYILDRASVKRLIEAAGFSIDKIVAGPLDVSMLNDHTPTKEYWVFVATKRSWMININPEVYQNGSSELKWLYKSNKGVDVKETQND